MTKILTSLALLATIASPAFAATAHQNLKSVRAASAYAMAPSAQDKFSAALNGGGTIGYNQAESQYVLTK